MFRHIFKLHEQELEFFEFLKFLRHWNKVIQSYQIFYSIQIEVGFQQNIFS